MQFVTYVHAGNPRTGMLVEGSDGDILSVVDLGLVAEIGLKSGKLRGNGWVEAAAEDLVSFIAAGPDAWSSLRRLGKDAAVLEAATRRIEQGALMAPIPHPRRNVFCVGRNYVEHIAEGDRSRGISTPLPAHPQFFTKPPSTIVGPGGKVEVDDTVSDKVDYEVELAVVIGRKARDVPADKAMEIVFGYTVANDVTARDLQRRHDQWFKGKGLDTFCPLGPAIVTADAVADPQALDLTCRINGELRQSASTSEMLFRIDRIIAELSIGMALEPGDIIMTGTPPGVGYAMTPPRFLRPGDVIESRIDGIGTLRNEVVRRPAA